MVLLLHVLFCFQGFHFRLLFCSFESVQSTYPRLPADPEGPGTIAHPDLLGP